MSNMNICVPRDCSAVILWCSPLSAYAELVHDSDITTIQGRDTIELPIALQYVNAGYCNITPVVNTVGLEYKNESGNFEIFTCSRGTGCNNEQVVYNLNALGNATIPPDTGEGIYEFEIDQICPSNRTELIINVEFSPGESQTSIHYIHV